MKTFKTIIVTFMLTAMAAIAGTGYFLVDEGIVTFEKRDVGHQKVVMIDGVVTEQRDWSELLGYTVKIDVVDAAYIGR